MSPVQILLIDDDKDDYLAFKDVIAQIPRHEFSLHWCASFDKAEQLIAKNEYDIYIVDYCLGQKSGVDLLKKVAPHKRSEPFIFLVEQGNEAIEQQAMKLGAADYLVKESFGPELVSRTLRYALQRKQIEDQRLAHLIQINKAKDEFISLASHQLRTPATGVKQYLGMVLEGFAGDISDKQRQMLEKAYFSNERQLHIVTDLLRVAQVDAGKVKLHRRKCNITKLIDDILKEQYGMFKNRKQTVVFETEHTRVEAFVDKQTMRMVIENIIDNASKYSPAGSRITVSSGGEAGQVTIKIKDNGVGISPADQPKLFQKFTRIDNPLSTMVGGTGLGLYWAKKIVDLHGGSIKVVSRTNKGSTFFITVPK